MEALAEECRKVMEEAPVSDCMRYHDATWEEMEGEAGKWVRAWTNSPGWLNYGMVFHGKEMASSVDIPETRRFLDLVAERYDIDIAGYSWLKPGELIEEHKDEMERTGKITIHVPLVVPPDNATGECFLSVKGTRQAYRKFLPLCFLDHLMHAASNQTAHDRVVMYLKVAPKDPERVTQALLDVFSLLK